MSTLTIIGLIILGLIILIGYIRVIILPFTGFKNFIMEIFLLDILGDILSWIVGTIDDMLE